MFTKKHSVPKLSIRYMISRFMLVLMILTYSTLSYAQVVNTVESNTKIIEAAPAQTPDAPAASLKESAIKSLTYQSIIATINMVFLTYATGSVIESAILTGALMATTSAMYTINNYAWDYFYPPPPPTTDGTIDLVNSTQRATLKFITYKASTWPVVTGSIYILTGSATMALAFGTGVSMLKTATFYIHSYAWDYYEAQMRARKTP